MAQQLPEARAAGRALLGTADNAAREGRVAEELAERLSAQADELNRYGNRLTPEDQGLVSSLRTSRSALLEIAAIRSAADLALQTAEAEASGLARASIRGSRSAAFVEDVEAVTESVIKSTGCDLVAGMLLPSERTSVSAEPPNVVPSARTIVDAVIRQLAVRWRLGEVQTALDWTGWGNGVLGAARKMANAPSGTLQTTSTVHSRAFYYYAKICHAPPS